MAGDTSMGRAVLELATEDADFKAGLTAASKETKQTAAAATELSNALKGIKLGEQAQSIAAGISAIGGATKLSDAEARKYLGTLNEAIQKSKRLGQDVPPDILKTRDALKQVDDATKRASAGAGSMRESLSNMAGTLGIAFSAGAVIAFGKSVFDSASALHDQAEKLDISIEAVQGFGFAAGQAGSSLEGVGKAINKMNDNLAGGDKATVKALKDAGLEFQTIRNMKPEDAFLAITDAIQGIRDPMVQTDVAMKLFGKSGAELLPAIREGFRAAANAASKMSTDTVNSLEAAQDAWGTLANKVTIATGTIIANALHAGKAITDSGSAAAMFAENVVKYGVGAAIAMANAQDRGTEAAKQNRDIILKLPPIHHKTAEELAAEEEARKKAIAAAEKYAEVVQKIFGATVPLTLQQKEQIITLGKLGVSTSLMADFLRITEAPIGKFTEALKEQAKAVAEIGKSIDKIPHNVPLRLVVSNDSSIVPQISIEAVKAASVASGAIKTITDATWGEIESRMKAMGVNTSAELSRLAGVAREQFESMKSSGLFTAAELQAAWEKWYAADRAARGQWASGFRADLETLVQAFTQLATVGGDTFSGVARGIATMLTGLNTAIKSVDTLQKGFALHQEKGGLAGIAGMASGIMGIVSAAMAAIGAIKGIWNAIAGTAGRDLVVDFANAQGGFDALHAKLLESGAAGEQLWIKLTQGVGRNDPKAAQAAIDEVTAALAKQKDQVAATAAAATQAAADMAAAQQAELDAITAKYSDAIKQIDSEYKSLSDSVGQEQEEAVMGVVETQQRARMAELEAQRAALEQQQADEIKSKDETFDQVVVAGQEARGELDKVFGEPLKIPYEFVPLNAPGAPAVPMEGGGYGRVTRPTLFFSRGNEDFAFSGEGRSFGLGALAQRPIVIEHTTNLDGRVVARNQIRHTPDELARVGVGR